MAFTNRKEHTMKRQIAVFIIAFALAATLTSSFAVSSAVAWQPPPGSCTSCK